MVRGGAVGEDGIAGGVLGIGRLHGYFHPIRDGLAHPSNTLDPTQPLATAHSYRLFRDPATTIARNIANSVISESSKQVKSLEGKNSPVQVVMMTPADLSQAKKAPSPAKYIIAGLLAGIILGYAIALIRHLADRRIHTTDDITDRIEKPIFATIPTSSTIETLSTDLTDYFKAAEAIRKLRTNLRYALIDSTSKVILVTSSVMGEGKSSVAGNLAKVVALAGDDVILIDADLRRPKVQKNFDLDDGLGLPEVLIGAAPLDQALRTTPTTDLSVLPCTDTPPNPSELLGSEHMSELLSFLAQDHVVIVDAPPVLPVTDSVILSRLADTVIVVAQVGHTTVDQVESAVSSIENAGGMVSGIVLNRADSSKLSHLRYGESAYGYGYTKYDSDYSSSPATASQPTPQKQETSGSKSIPRRATSKHHNAHV
ncbi:polysaccharide biosynthesis tyrosine autokinase [Cutibacterium avidum]|uniref:polysaccharide biosynthesis tyrosine autokinase n=1 Tax=Cutibacterium avidum TaxID=33010 RepID=UPI002A5A3D97|nr:polysaccharide biosynthesis tyrosine autokinase [Cutibacterium avidum]MDY0760236.1 polysaccharide biosynthesis tyrosine autokinase [Cutibacterium avidum]